MLYSVVIPVYNSTSSLRPLVERLVQVFAEQVRAEAEIILVDDGSANPGTWAAIQELSTAFSQVKGVQLMRNFGKPGAVFCGLQEATGHYVITLDDDLQHAPEDIPLLIAMQHHDVVIARFMKLHAGPLKRFSSLLKDKVQYWAIGKPRELQITPFKLFKAEVVRSMRQLQTPHPSIAAQLFFVTRDVVNVEVPHYPRQHGRSGFSLLKMVHTMLNLLLNNSSFLLRVVATVGILISLVSFGLGLYYIILKLSGQIKVSGWTTLVVISLFTSGLVLFTLGIIGEYLVRIINGIEHRPAFIVRQRSERKVEGLKD